MTTTQNIACDFTARRHLGLTRLGVEMSSLECNLEWRPIEVVELLHELAKAGLLQLVLLNLHHLLLPPGYDDDDDGDEDCENNHDNDGDDDGNYDEKSYFGQKNFGDENDYFSYTKLSMPVHNTCIESLALKV